MIIQFSVENHKSIKEETTLFMNAIENEMNEDILLKSNEEKILPYAVLYGANNVGKTNILSSISMISFLLKFSLIIMPGKEIPINTFRFDEEFINKPSKFKIVFINDGIKYAYGIEITKEEVVSEYLYHYPNGRQALIFKREKLDFEFGTTFKSKLEDLKEKTIKNKLFLTVAAAWSNDEIISKTYSYLTNSIVINIGVESINWNWLEYTTTKVIGDQKFKNMLTNFLKQLGNNKLVEIIGKINKKTYKEEELPVEMPIELKKIISDKESTTPEFKVVYEYNGNHYFMDIQEESKGFNKFVELSGPIMDILENGKILVFDELETSLHPELLLFFISLFKDKLINKNNAQLIFSTHNTEILNYDNFRRDQIYFIEKKETGASDLYSLADLKNVRKDENIRKGYLNGKYGKIPFFSNNLIVEALKND